MTSTQETRVALTLAAYQAKAVVTAEPRAFELEYLVPGILGEVGELFGQEAKAHWHGWPAEKLQTELVSEYGDICWMTALLLETRKVHQLQPTFPANGSARYGVQEPKYQLSSAALTLYRNYLLEDHALSERDEWLDESAERLWRLLRENCLLITRTPFQDVLHYNLQKLADRAARGVLRGSGDHR